MIRIGISGWRYGPWRGVFYPEGLAQRRETPPGFVFAVKGSRDKVICASGCTRRALDEWASRIREWHRRADCTCISTTT